MTVEHCMIALLWQASDDDISTGLYDPSDELRDKVAADWSSFKTQCELLGFNPEEALTQSLHPDHEGDPWNAVAHDFILTRNHHGCGFWDGKWAKPWNVVLTELAIKFGDLELYLGDDNLIYGV